MRIIGGARCSFVNSLLIFHEINIDANKNTAFQKDIHYNYLYFQGLSNLGNTCFFNAVMQVSSWHAYYTGTHHLAH